jgi:Mrp family chromosome partitioning ATPase
MREQAFLAQGVAQSAVAEQPASDVTLGLVQRIFLQTPPNAPRVVVFAAIDPGDGCSQIAASAAESLAAIAPNASVCLVDANFRSPALSNCQRF